MKSPLLPRCILPAFLICSSIFASAQVAVSLRPRRAPVTLKQKQQFTATVTGTTNTGVTWSVDNIAGGNATVGTISTAGVYTPPAAAGTHTVLARSKASTSVVATATVWVTDYPGLMTHHADKFRSGLNSQELALTATTVNNSTFGKLFSRTVDGQIYTQPLHVANLSIGGVFRNVVFVATEHDSVYAFDADGRTSAPIWKRSFINTAGGITTLGKSSNSLIAPEIGITGTPAIDQASNTLYVSALTVEHGTIVHRLHALSLTTGAEKFGGPVAISGSFGGVAFAPSRHLQRPALLFLTGNVYIAFGSHGDALPYQGWLFAYSASGGTLHCTAVINFAPTANGAAAIWMSGGGPAADNSGFIYIVTGNGLFNLNTGGADAGNSIVKLNGSLHIVDFYTPSDQAALNEHDWDLGAGGPMVVPTQSGAAVPSLLITGGKDGKMYIVNRSNLGHFSATNDPAIQKVDIGDPPPSSGNFFTPANFNGFVYFGGFNQPLMAFKFAGGRLPASTSSQSPNIFAYPGATPTVSANGAANGIVWAIDNSKYVGGTPGGAVHASGPAVLHAYQADNLGTELYNSTQAGSRDTAGPALKFTVPTVANGRVYVGGSKVLTVYGVLP